uniref:Uncharacterized protein n=1 Tax=Arundo donax TaxID=35708 RepID=A0A0A9AXN4_ARUDO
MMSPSLLSHHEPLESRANVIASVPLDNVVP